MKNGFCKDDAIAKRMLYIRGVNAIASPRGSPEKKTNMPHPRYRRCWLGGVVINISPRKQGSCGPDYYLAAGSVEPRRRLYIKSVINIQ